LCVEWSLGCAGSGLDVGDTVPHAGWWWSGGRRGGLASLDVAVFVLVVAVVDLVVVLRR
jgi:hypothetical protein